jgi:Ca-activated chloride channel family protein
MFTFQWFWCILLLPVPLLVRKILPAAPLANQPPQLRFAALPRVQQAFAHHTHETQTHRLKYLLLWSGWIALVFTLMYPQLIDKHVEVKQTGYDLMLAIDLSESMHTSDFYTPQNQVINRFEAVKYVIKPFVEKRAGDRLGLILFADHAYLQAPLTLDNQAVNILIQKAMLGMAGKKTAIGDAIGLAVKKLRDRPENSRVLILLTDGENTAGKLEPLKAAELAQQYHIQIYTIGIGMKDDMGRGFDEKTLNKIANLTNGQYYPATSLDALAQVYQHIDSTLKKTEAESRVYIQRTPLYHYPLLVAMAALLLLQILHIYVRDTA